MTTNYEEVLANLKKTADKFSDKLTELNNQNNDVKQTTEKLLETMSTLKGSSAQTFCKICYNSSRPPNFALKPCYHASFCQNCAQRALNRGRCPICRSDIESFVKIFI